MSMSRYQKFYTNQIYSSSLLCQLSYMWKNQVLCDAVIKSGSLSVKAHRILLIASCPMLQSMENATVGSQLEVRLAADIKLASITTFLQYLYEGFMMLTENNCKDVEKIARLLQVDSVIQCCMDFSKCIKSKCGAKTDSDGSDFYRYTFHNSEEFRHVRSSDVLTSTEVLTSDKNMSIPAHDITYKRGADSGPFHASQCKRSRVHGSDRGSNIPTSCSQQSSMGNNSCHTVSSSLVPSHDSERLSTKSLEGPLVQQKDVNVVEDSLQLLETNSDQSTGELIQRSVGLNVVSHISDASDTQVLNVTQNASDGRSRSGSYGSHRDFEIVRDSSANRDFISGLLHSTSVRDTDSRSSDSRINKVFPNQQSHSANISNVTHSGDALLISKQHDKISGLSHSNVFSASEDRNTHNLNAMMGNNAHSADNALGSLGTERVVSPVSMESVQDVSLLEKSGAESLMPPTALAGAEAPTVTVASHFTTNTNSSSLKSPNAASRRGSQEVQKSPRSESSELYPYCEELLDLSIVKQEMDISECNEVSKSSYGQSAKRRGAIPWERGRGQTVGHDFVITTAASTNYNKEMQLAQEHSQSQQLSQSNHQHSHTTHSNSQHVPAAHSNPQSSFPLSTMLPPIGHMTQNMSLVSAGNAYMQYAADLFNFPTHKSRRRSVDDLGHHDSHRLVYIANRKPCVWCQINRVKTKSGWYCYASYRCVKCDVPLCKQGRDCFLEYHKHIGVPANELINID